MTPRLRILLILLAIVVIGSGVFLAYQQRPSADVTLQSQTPVELVVGPGNVLQVGFAYTKFIIGVRGSNGYTGPVTVSVDGAPVGTDVVCDSNCGPAGAWDGSMADQQNPGRPPYHLTAVDGEWRMFAPQLITNSLKIPNETRDYPITVTATANGTTVTKTVTLHYDKAYDNPPGSTDGSLMTFHNVGTIGCVFTSDQQKRGFSQPLEPSNKELVTAGGSVSYLCHMNAPSSDDGQGHKWPDGTVMHFVSTQDDVNSPVHQPTLTATFSPDQGTFNKPNPPVFSGQGDTTTTTSGAPTLDYSKQVDTRLTIQTTKDTPNGVYVIGIGSRCDEIPYVNTSCPSGSLMNMQVDAVLSVTGSSAKTSDTATPTTTSTATSTNQTASPTATSAPTNSASSPLNTTSPVAASQPKTTSSTTSTSPIPSSSVTPTTSPSVPIVGSLIPSPSISTGASFSDPVTNRTYTVTVATVKRTITISGHVTSDDGAGFAGANINAKGSNALSDLNGWYVYQYSDSAVTNDQLAKSLDLQVDAPGFEVQTISVPLPTDQSVVAISRDIQLTRSSSGPQVKLDQTTVKTGGAVHVSVAQYPPNTQLKLFWDPYLTIAQTNPDGSPLEMTQAGTMVTNTSTGNLNDATEVIPTTDGQGAATFSVLVPTTPGQHRLLVTDQLHQTLTANDKQSAFAHVLNVRDAVVRSLTITFTVDQKIADQVTTQAAQALYNAPVEKLTQAQKQQLGSLLASTIGVNPLADPPQKPADGAVLTTSSSTASLSGAQTDSCTTTSEAPSLVQRVLARLTQPAIAQAAGCDLYLGQIKSLLVMASEVPPPVPLYQLSNQYAINLRAWLKQILDTKDEDGLKQIGFYITNGLGGTNYSQISVPGDKNTIGYYYSFVAQAIQNGNQNPAQSPKVITSATPTAQYWQISSGYQIAMLVKDKDGTILYQKTLSGDDFNQLRNVDRDTLPWVPAIKNQKWDQTVADGGSIKITIWGPLGTTPIILEADGTKPDYQSGFNSLTSPETVKLLRDQKKVLKHAGIYDLDGHEVAVLDDDLQSTANSFNQTMAIATTKAFEAKTAFENIAGRDPLELAFGFPSSVVFDSNDFDSNSMYIGATALWQVTPGLYEQSQQCPQGGCAYYYSQDFRVAKGLHDDSIPAVQFYNNSYAGLHIIHSGAQPASAELSRILGAAQDRGGVRGTITAYAEAYKNKKIGEFALQIDGLTKSIAQSRAFVRELGFMVTAVENKGQIIGQTNQFGIARALAGDSSTQITTTTFRGTNYIKITALGTAGSLLVTDPLGRSVGINPFDNTNLNQVPGATISGQHSGLITIFLPGIDEGSYQYSFTPDTKGSATILVERAIGNDQPQISSFVVQATAGQTNHGTLTVNFATRPTIGFADRIANLARYGYHAWLWLWWTLVLGLGALFIVLRTRHLKQLAHATNLTRPITPTGARKLASSPRVDSRTKKSPKG